MAVFRSSSFSQLASFIPVLVLASNILPFLLHSFYIWDLIRDRATSWRDVETTFDYIIVGGGSAGCVLASRLTEDPNVKVLLLEAGGDPNPLHNIPLLTFPLLNQPHVDWRYFTQPQTKSCLAMNNNACAWPRGKSLGGSSNLNFMIYVRGFPRDYDNWANLTGDERWAYRNVLPFFKKSEDYHGHRENDQYHGKGGPLNVAHSPYKGMAELFVEAGQEFGYPRADPSVEFNTKAFTPLYYTQKNGQRHSTYRAFLRPAQSRANLIVYKFAHVTKILFEGLQNRAVGVSYFRFGQKKVARAKREVIIAAGALNTPQILMLSGIGSKNHLSAFDIPVVSDLPVGLNLQDHISTILGPFIVDAPVSLRIERDITPKAVTQFFYSGEGPLTTTTPEATSFFPSELAIGRGEENWPDIQQVYIGTAPGRAHAVDLTRVFNVKPGILNELFQESFDKDSFIIMNILNRPASRGNVKLGSTNPFDPLLFNPNYLDQPQDLKVLIEGAKKAVEFIEGSKTFQKIGGRLTSTPFPPCKKLKMRSDEYWECHHRQYSLTVWHPCCTAPMGRKGDKDAVVDSELRVFGTKNLRVIDTSIMPVIVAGNTNAPTIMIAEMGAHFIQMEALKFKRR